MSKAKNKAKTASTSTNRSSASGFIRKNAYSVIVFIFCMAIYSNSVFNDYNLDDELVTKNHALTSKGISAIPEIFSSPYYSDNMGYAYDYRPIVHVSFAIEHSLFGDSPRISHLINVILYAFLCVLLFRVMHFSLLTTPLFAFSIAMLFAAFPLHTEAVCSIKNRDEILALTFALLCLYYATKFSQTGFVFLLPASVFFTFSLLSKFSVVVFGLIIPINVFVFSRLTLTRAVVLNALLTVPVFFLYQQPFINDKLIFAFLFFVFPLVLYFPLIILIKKISILAHFVLHKLQVFLQKLRDLWVDRVVVPLKTQDGHVASELGERKLKHLVVVLVISQIFLFLTAFFLGYSSLLLIWYAQLAVFVVLAPNSQVKISMHFLFLACTVLVSALIPHISNNNPLPILVSVSILGFLIPRLSKSKFSRSISVWLMLLFVNICVQFIYIGDVDSVFPAIGLTLLFASRAFPNWFRNLGLWIIGSLCAVQAILLILRVSYAFNVDRVIHEFLTFVSLALTFSGIYKGRAVNSYKNITTALIFCYILFYKENLTSVFSISTPVNWLNSPLDDNSRAPQPSTTEIITNFDHPKKELSPPKFEILEKASDRPIDFVESPVTLWDDMNTRVGSAAVVGLHYLKKMFVPYPMSFYYGYKMFRPEKITSASAIISLLIHLLLGLAMFYFLAKDKVLGFAIFIYLSSVASVSGFLQPIAGVVADRFALIPSIGFAIAITWLIFKSFKLGISDESITAANLPKGAKVSFLALLVLYSGLTFSRNFQWKDDLTLMRHDIAYADQSAQAHNLLGLHLVQTSFKTQNPSEQLNLRNEALPHFKTALSIYPEFFNVSYDIGRLYLMLNQPDSALFYFQNTISLDSTFSDCHLNVGEILFQQKRYKEAVPYFEYVIKDRPLEYTGYDKLSFLFFTMKEYEKSILINRMATLKVPGVANPYLNMGKTFIAIGKPDSALYYLKIADRILPNNREIIQTIQTAEIEQKK